MDDTQADKEEYISALILLHIGNDITSDFGIRYHTAVRHIKTCQSASGTLLYLYRMHDCPYACTFLRPNLFRTSTRLESNYSIDDNG